MKTFNYALCATALLASSTVAKALTTDTLQDLVNTSGSLSIGDKTFSGFGYVASGLSGFDASNIQVTASQVGGVYFLTWGGSIALVSGGFATADLLLNYNVTANPGSITMIDQSYTGSAQPNGGAFLAVDETVLVGTSVVANSHLQVGDLSDPFAETGDNLNVNPSQHFLLVTKDIGMGLINGGFVTISQVQQSFHQNAVPDGGTTAAMLGLALVGIEGMRRKLRH